MMTPASQKKVFIYLLSVCSCFQPVYSCFSGDNFRPIGVCYTVRKIKAIRDRLDSLTRDKDQLNLIVRPAQEDNHRRLLTTSLIDMSEICGREDEKSTIMSWLTEESSQQEMQVSVPVISIVGMGGFGKTTLAQLIYKDPSISTTFDQRVWVCVSEPFDVQKVFKDITELAGKGANASSLEALQHSLCASVRGTRFLLVLDDVWSEDRNDWTPIKLSLEAGAPGSRIIVTTRSMGVANMMGSRYTLRLGQLRYDDCHSLFWRIAFSGRPREEFQKFKLIGDEIVKKCKGVPLAVKAIASLMPLKRTIQDWRNVLASEIWKLNVEKNLLPALLLSYYALPTSLKQCFAYCAIFPKGTCMDRDELVQLWMAQGYLGVDDEENELEMIGVEYFEDLSMRSLFQRFVYFDRCNIHDLVHDLALFLTESECTIFEKNSTRSDNGNIRHINALHLENHSILKSRNLRSLFLSYPLEFCISELLIHLRYLRVLSLPHGSFEYLPDEVGKLSHLRYFDLSNNQELKKLPETVCNFFKLQTLKLGGCRRLCELPEEIGKLSKLRHLEIGDTLKLSYIPRSIGKLKCLRSLCRFMVSPADEGCGIGELRSLNNLRGTLTIEGLKHATGGVDEAKLAELWKKKNIARLELYFTSPFWFQDYVRSEEDMKRVEGTLEGLQPDVSLEELGIFEFSGLTFPFWLSLLPNVVKLGLSHCKNCIQLPALGRLTSLETLVISGFESVKHIELDAADSGNGRSTTLVLFPKLKYLTLYDLPNWEEEMEGKDRTASIMPCLIDLHISLCPKLKVVPNYLFSPSLRKLSLGECPELTGAQPRLPSLLEEVIVNGDVGGLSDSLSKLFY